MEKKKDSGFPAARVADVLGAIPALLGDIQLERDRNRRKAHEASEMLGKASVVRGPVFMIGSHLGAAGLVASHMDHLRDDLESLKWGDAEASYADEVRATARHLVQMAGWVQVEPEYADLLEKGLRAANSADLWEQFKAVREKLESLGALNGPKYVAEHGDNRQAFDHADQAIQFLRENAGLAAEPVQPWRVSHPSWGGGSIHPVPLEEAGEDEYVRLDGFNPVALPYDVGPIVMALTISMPERMMAAEEEDRHSRPGRP